MDQSRQSNLRPKLNGFYEYLARPLDIIASVQQPIDVRVPPVISRLHCQDSAKIRVRLSDYGSAAREGPPAYGGVP
jgi:hypothetical protein